MDFYGEKFLLFCIDITKMVDNIHLSADALMAYALPVFIIKLATPHLSVPCH